MNKQMAERISRHHKCPSCRQGHGIVTSARYGTLVLFCPDCDQGWTDVDWRKNSSDPRKQSIAVEQERRVQVRRVGRAVSR